MAGTSASTRTRDSGSSVTVVVTGSVAMAVSLYKPLVVRSRLAARYYTGPLGHLVAGAADWAELLVRWKWSQMVSRFKRSRTRR